MITANKGEWSEFYVMLKILIEKGFYGVDSGLKKRKDLFFSVIQIHGDRADVIYELSSPREVLILSDKDSKMISNEYLQMKLKIILDTIKNTNERTFAIPEAEELMEEIMCNKMKSSSFEKGDIKLTFEEPETKQIITDFFSIKSFLAGKPTLLNASKHTIFKYRVSNLSQSQIEEVNSIFNSKESIDVTNRIKRIYDFGGSMELAEIASETMEKNLKKIDSLFPLEIGNVLRDSYLYQRKKVIDLIKDSQLEDIKRKMGEFLEATLKGMMPSIEWDLLNVANGLILVIDGGEIVGFHICNKKELIEFLLKDSYLDTPSTSRHHIGKIYKEKNIYQMDLSLQIRLS